MDITKSQISAAMALLDITQAGLAVGTGLSKPTISNFLKSSTGWETKESTKSKIVDYLRLRGIEFTEHNGIRENPITYELKGKDGFRYFFDDVYHTACEAKEGEFLFVFNNVPELIIKWLGEDWYENHRERMTKIKDRYTFYVIVEKGTKRLIAKSFVNYRFWPSDKFTSEMVYVYGSKVAFIKFLEDDVTIQVNSNKRLADTMRFMFSPAWEKAISY